MNTSTATEVSTTLVRLHEHLGQVESDLSNVEGALQQQDPAVIDRALADLRQHLGELGSGRQPPMLTPSLRQRMARCQRRVQGLQVTLVRAQGSVTRLLSQLLPEAQGQFQALTPGYGSSFGQAPARSKGPGSEP